MPRGVVAVVGSTGFIGSSIRNALQASDVPVRPITAPRMGCQPGGIADVHRAVGASAAVIGELAERLSDTHVVVNAAGIADASTRAEAALFGANAVLPRVIREAAVAAGVQRLIHVSSAAVQGRRLLDETSAVYPFNPYSHSKALAEEALESCPETVVFRPTSVHGADRRVTQAVARLARSRLASVGGDGSSPSPQVLVQNVGSAVNFLCEYEGRLPKIVLQPDEGMTARSLLTILGGKDPVEVPRPLASAVVWSGRAAARRSPRMLMAARRLEMLWFGQAQVSGWLTSSGWKPTVGVAGWHELANCLTDKENDQRGDRGK